ncbi:MAG: DUF1345 domain-containing protein [Ferruginibacter sp.]
MQSKKANNAESWILKMHPLHRALLSFLLSGVVWLLLRSNDFEWKVTLLFMWIAFGICYLMLSWLMFFNCPPAKVSVHAGKEDGSRVFVFLLILLSSFAGMLTVVLLVIQGDDAAIPKLLLILLAIVSMFISWGMVHTTYTFHYAHLFYDISDKGREKTIGGLSFPGEKQPDYLDCAYFSFVIGMTFQVSDVTITSTVIRRVVLLHSLLSFALNTIVVALTFNLIAGQMK